MSYIVSQGGFSSGIKLEKDRMDVYAGGSAYDTQIFNGGSVVLHEGGTADYTTVNSSGALHVSSGAEAYNTTVKRYGYLGIGNGANAYNTTIDYAGELTVWGGGYVGGNTINEYGAILLSSGAVADYTVINNKGGLHVYSGAVASNTTVNQGGIFGVGLGATAYNTIIGYAGELTVWGGGAVNHNTIDEYGAIILKSGAVANDTVINDKGGLHVYSGAVANSTTVRQGGFFGVGLGAVASDTYIAYGGSLTVWGGGTVHNTEIDYYGALILSSGAVGNSTTVSSGGGLHIYSGATAYSTEVTFGAALGIGGGGALYGAELSEDATMTFYDSSILRGWTNVSGSIITSGKVDAEGAYLNFDDSSTSGGGYVDNLDNFTGNYNIYVSIDVLNNYHYNVEYAFAGGAENFNGSVNLMIDGEDVADLTLGKSFNYNGVYYTLQKSGGTLGVVLTATDISIPTPNPTVSGVNTITVNGLGDVAFEDACEKLEEENWMNGGMGFIDPARLPAGGYYGMVNGTDGVDQVVFTGGQSRYIESLYLHAGDDTVVLQDSANLDDDDSEVEVALGPVNEFGVSGMGRAMDFGEGNNTLYIGEDYDLDAYDVSFGSGNDAIQCLGEIECSNLSMGNGNNSLYFQDADFSAMAVTAGNGNDSIVLAGDTWFTVNGYSDTDTVGNLVLGAGDDRISISAESRMFTCGIDFGAGNDSLELNGILQVVPVYMDSNINGLENVSGTGTLAIGETGYYTSEWDSATESYINKWVSTGLSVDDTTLALFKNAGIDIVNVGESYGTFSGRAKELANNTFQTAEVISEDDEGFAAWLCGADKAASMEYGMCDDVDFYSFTKDADKNYINFYTYGGINGQLLDSAGNVIAAFNGDEYYYDLLDISSLANGGKYVIMLTIDSDKCGFASISFEEENMYDYYLA